uniref:SHSP domain-containing protein n=1 Tax=Kalanchoe fedtschenkoi TaxID=63787 RepID=A0A7N0U7H7_KALFE
MQAAVFTQPEEFEPKCEWVHEDVCDTLLAHVPGYKKENLKVQVTTSGNLRVLGERKINDKRSVRFLKEFSLPEGCDMDGITAKFEEEVLQVRLAKKASAPAMHKEEAKQETKHSAAPEDEKPHDKSDSKTQERVEAGAKKSIKEAESSKQNEKSEGLADVAKDDKHATEQKYQKMHPRNLMPKKTTLLAVLILVVAVALGLGMVRQRGVSIKSYSTDGE